MFRVKGTTAFSAQNVDHNFDKPTHIIINHRVRLFVFFFKMFPLSESINLYGLNLLYSKRYPIYCGYS